MADIIERRGKRKLCLKASELADMPGVQKNISNSASALPTHTRPRAPESEIPLSPKLRASRLLPKTGEPYAVHPQEMHLAWTFPVGLGMTLVSCVLLMWMWVVAPFFGSIARQWHYGDSRTSTLSARVGHQDKERPTLFIGTILDHQLQVIELPGGNAQAVKVYTIGQVAEKVDAVMRFAVEDINGDRRLDLLVTIETNTVLVSVLYNNGESFQTSVPLPKGEEPEQKKGGKPDEQQ